MRLTCLLILVLAAAACGGDDGMPRLVPLTGDDGGTTVEVRVGDELMIELEGNPTTGFNWVYDSGDDRIAAPLGEPTFRSDTDLPGSGGIVTWRFEAVEEGTTTIELAYRQPWDEETPAERWFVVSVVVTADPPA